ncbi:MAG: 23S rRNA (guanosine(2251)-2'-O)-methyltransferase RlmB [Deltaproteobacteria bacterium]|nr:23S rRNA (guanosine(2251)-2'-O)-methyltransferase RlmB [Deltaproteobacteria bacterium]
MKRILCGPQAAREALRADPRRVAAVFVARAGEEPIAELLDLARRAQIPVEERPVAELDALTAAGGARRHQGVVAITGDYPYRSLDELLAGATRTHLLVVCDEIQDPHNLGAMVRSAVFFGGTGIVIGKQRMAPVSAGAVRASAGATEHARIARVTNIAETIRALEREGIRTVGLDAAAAEPIGSFDLRGPVALVVGREDRGLGRLVKERCMALARIPAGGPLGSLNASVACAVALYEVSAQRAREERERR